MPWDWNSLPSDGTVSNTGGGRVGSADEAREKSTWPRYEAEYLKKALAREDKKYDPSGLPGAAQKQVYLEQVSQNYKQEAEEALKGEFELWLQGMHECNDSKNNEYVNGEGRPIRRWVFKDEESKDANGNSKVGLARAGWRHTPWGRQPLTHLTGVRDYLRSQRESAAKKDLDMQLLAEYGPQDLDQAWMYFKHWVKGRPVTEAVVDPPDNADPAKGRTIGEAVPTQLMMQKYRPTPDRQSDVLATDYGADLAAAPKPYEAPPVMDPKTLRERLEDLVEID